MPITIAEAINGGDVEVPTLRGIKRIRIPAGTRHGSIQRLRGEGPPKPGGGSRGDIRYRISVEIPTGLDDEQRRALDEFAATLDGHDPRERILRDARIRAARESAADRSDDSGKVGAK